MKIIYAKQGAHIDTHYIARWKGRETNNNKRQSLKEHSPVFSRYIRIVGYRSIQSSKNFSLWSVHPSAYACHFGFPSSCSVPTLSKRIPILLNCVLHAASTICFMYSLSFPLGEKFAGPLSNSRVKQDQFPLSFYIRLVHVKSCTSHITPSFASSRHWMNY